MKRNKKILVLIILIFIISFLVGSTVSARSTEFNGSAVEYTKEFKEYLKLTNEEKEKTIQPRIYDILGPNSRK